MPHDRELGNLQQAVYCYNKAVRADPEDMDLLYDRSFVYWELGEPKRVRLNIPFVISTLFIQQLCLIDLYALNMVCVKHYHLHAHTHMHTYDL